MNVLKLDDKQQQLLCLMASDDDDDDGEDDDDDGPNEPVITVHTQAKYFRDKSCVRVRTRRMMVMNISYTQSIKPSNIRILHLLQCS